MTISVPVVEIGLIGPNGQLPFSLVLYGIPMSEFTRVPSPVVPKIREALQRRGIDPDSVTVSPFFLRERRFEASYRVPAAARKEPIDWSAQAGLNA